MVGYGSFGPVVIISSFSQDTFTSSSTVFLSVELFVPLDVRTPRWLSIIYLKTVNFRLFSPREGSTPINHLKNSTVWPCKGIIISHNFIHFELHLTLANIKILMHDYLVWYGKGLIAISEKD